MSNRQISERSYAIRSFKEVTEQAINYQEQLLDRHEKNMRKLLTFYRDLIEENEQVLEEIDQECQAQINEDLAYALQFLNVYDPRINLKRLSAAVDDTVFLYGLSDMLARGLALVRYFVPKKGELYSDIIREYFFRNVRNTDEIIIEMLPDISRRQYYREKKRAIRLMGYYFYEIVVPQVRSGRYKPSFPEDYD